ncbi:glycosyltransferase [Streptomyces sp. NPDC054784]
MRSALVVDQYDAAYLHCDVEPAGEYWQRLREHFTVRPCFPPTEVGGREIRHVAHRADVARLQILLEEGGTYLDTDVLCVRSMESLRGGPAVLGAEGEGGPAEVAGACNAVVLSEPGGAFVRDWLAGFDPATSLWGGFRSRGRDRFWSEYSVQYPAFLARGRDDVVILGPHAFYFPMWYELDLEDFFLGTARPDGDPFCHHLWQSHPWVASRIATSSIPELLGGASTFSQQLRSVFGAEGDLLCVS